MAITFTNIWEDKILEVIRLFLNTEFVTVIPVYTGDFKDMGSQSIRLLPIGSDLIEEHVSSELREYILDVSYVFKEKTVKRDTWKHILRQLSRIEALFQDNMVGSGNSYFNGRLQTCRINEKTEEEAEVDGLNVIRWEWTGMYLGNLS